MFSACAQQYLTLGLAVIPCNGKKPALRRWKPFQGRLPTTGEIDAWAAEYPGANIGTVTGAASGITVVDVDAADEIENALQAYGSTPLMVTTPRGGRHLYYRYNGESTEQKINGLPIDIRARGGFVVLPPSINLVTRMPYRLLQGDFSLIKTLPTANNLPATPSIRKAAKLLKSIVAGEVIPEGERNATLFKWLKDKAFSYVKMEELMDAALATNNLMLDPPLLELEVTAIVKIVWGYKGSGN